METPWKVRADEVRAAALAAAIAKRPGFRKRQEANNYLEMAYEGRRYNPKAVKEAKEVEDEADAAVDAWSDSDESERLMGEAANG